MQHPRRILFTTSGYQNIKKKLEETIAQRPLAVEDLQKARAMGDLSENGYYKAAKSKLVSIDREIRRLRYLVNYGKVADMVTSDFVVIGSRVEVTDGKETHVYTVVGEQEADPSLHFVSLVSPLGKALLNRKVGDRITFSSPKGEKTLTINAISFSQE